MSAGRRTGDRRGLLDEGCGSRGSNRDLLRSVNVPSAAVNTQQRTDQSNARAGSRQATRLLLWAWALLGEREHALCYEASCGFVILRPRSHWAIAIWRQRPCQLGRIKEADDAYQRAMELDGTPAALRVLYGQFLGEHGQITRGLRILRDVRSGTVATFRCATCFRETETRFKP
jgi:predicted Zn-dependent protease